MKTNAVIYAIKNLPEKWLALGATSSCLSLIFFNFSAIPVALPSIGNDLHISKENLDWIINVYFLMFAIVILPAGRLTDIFGVRRLISLGLSIYVLGSLLFALSMNFSSLLVSRVIQGAGGALIFPAIGAHLITVFPSEERGKSMGLNTGISSIFWILGPLLGGGVAQYLGWRYLVLFNLPIAFLGLLITFLTIPIVEKKKESSFDFLGTFFLALIMGSLTVALMEGSTWGWTTSLTQMFFGIAATSTLFFIIVYRFCDKPVIDLSYFRVRSFTIGTCCACLSQIISIVTVFWALFLQNDLSYSPTFAGGMILFSNLPVIFISPLAGYLGDKFGFKLPIILGFFLTSAGLIWLTIFATSGGMICFISALIIFGVGQPMIMAPSYAASLNDIKMNSALASGITLALRQISLTFGMAIMSALYFFVLESEHSVLGAFQSVNLSGVVLGMLGILMTLIFLSSKSPSSSQIEI